MNVGEEGIEVGGMGCTGLVPTDEDAAVEPLFFLLQPLVALRRARKV